MADESTTGILNPGGIGTKFRLARFEPAPDLAPLVERYWAVDWDLPPDEPHFQETLPFPCVQLAVCTQEEGTGLFGVVKKRFSVLLRGRGSVFGLKFRPGAFYPFLQRPVSSITGMRIPLAGAFGAEGAALEAGILAAPSPEERLSLAEDFLRARLPAPDDGVAEVGRIVERIIEDREIRKVDDLVERVGLNKRALQRSFSRYVGASPKWVIQRYRLQEAADRAASGEPVSWAMLALDLGYFDQAHFIKDFKAVIGVSPAEYARSAAG